MQSPSRGPVIERMTVTLYRVDLDMWQRFRIAVLKQGSTVNDAVVEAVVDWLKKHDTNTNASTP